MHGRKVVVAQLLEYLVNVGLGLADRDDLYKMVHFAICKNPPWPFRQRTSMAERIGLKVKQFLKDELPYLALHASARRWDACSAGYLLPRLTDSQRTFPRERQSGYACIGFSSCHISITLQPPYYYMVIEKIVANIRFCVFSPYQTVKSYQVFCLS